MKDYYVILQVSRYMYICPPSFSTSLGIHALFSLLPPSFNLPPFSSLSLLHSSVTFSHFFLHPSPYPALLPSMHPSFPQVSHNSGH